MAYSFKNSLKKGEESERDLDRYFSKWYDIEPATMAQQKSGIDRIFTSHIGRVITVEYKTDWTAIRTGNAFIELTAWNDGKKRKDGWALTCSADKLVYLVPGKTMLVIEPSKLKARALEWKKYYRIVKIQNEGFYGEGMPIPLRLVEALSYKVLSGNL